MKFISLILLCSIAFPLSAAAQLEKTEESLESSERPLKKHRALKRGEKAQKMLRRIDTNADGKIDLNEYLTNAEQRFQAMDQDGNGFVIPEEMRAHGKAMRIKHRSAMKAARKAYRESKELSEGTKSPSDKSNASD